MPKTTTKKITKKTEEKPVITEAKEIKQESIVPVFATEQIPSDDMGDDDISKEIAKTIKESAGKADRYFEAIGRRKTAVARVRLFTKGDKDD